MKLHTIKCAMGEKWRKQLWGDIPHFHRKSITQHLRKYPVQFHEMSRIIHHEIFNLHSISSTQTQMTFLIQLPRFFVDIKVGCIDIGWQRIQLHVGLRPQIHIVTILLIVKIKSHIQNSIRQFPLQSKSIIIRFAIIQIFSVQQKRCRSISI